MPIARAVEPVAMAPLPSLRSWLLGCERGLLLGVTLLIVAIPLAQMAARTLFDYGLIGAGALSQNLALWIGWLGAVSAAMRGRHLGLGDALRRLVPGLERGRAALVALVSAGVSAWLFAAAVEFVRFEMSSAALIAGWLPIWVAEMAIPIGLFGVTASYFLAPGANRIAALLGLPAAALAAHLVGGHGVGAALPVLALLILAFMLGAPIFVLIGGSALLLFSAIEVPTAAVALEGYRMATSPIIPAIPLFTLVGFLMTASRASERLVEVFRALFGWFPGGVALASVLVCAFFASFTGSSGVLILALGGLLVPVLTKAGYAERFSIGLVTCAGSAGLLLPPSLALILFAVVAQISILDIFAASLLPAGIMILGIAGFAVWRGVRNGATRERFEPARAARALWIARWELATPVIALGGIFGGFTTLLEAAALTVGYTLFVSTVIHREIDPRRDLGEIVRQSSTLIGGIFIILATAMALTSFLVDAQVPDLAADWAVAHIGSPLLFLLGLNLILLIAGCVMDVFSAIAVLTPLLLPIGVQFGISPVHLGVIFLANLELGYLTPPVGMNLYLAAFRFDKPLGEVIVSVLPILGVMLVFVLAITYLPLVVAFPGF
ncbi:MAG: TRAP transporter large permease [Alphaproteobacteria bacterium]